MFIAGLGCYTVKCSEILAHMEQLYNPRVNKYSLHFKKKYFDTQEGFLKRTIFGLKIISVINKEKKTSKNVGWNEIQTRDICSSVL